MSNPEIPFEVELTINKGRTEPYDLGDGYGHLAVSVPDVEAGVFYVGFGEFLFDGLGQTAFVGAIIAGPNVSSSANGSGIWFESSGRWFSWRPNHHAFARR